MRGHRRPRRPPRQPRQPVRKPCPLTARKVALVLQGGGALGAYQAGVYEALAERGYLPHWITGISIGAINGAIIAGNPPELRVERLRAFWEQITDGIAGKPLLDGDFARGLFNEWSALASVTSGVDGFYSPAHAAGLAAALGYGRRAQLL